LKYLYLYQEDERSCICLLGVSLSTIFLLNVSTMWYFLFFILIHLITILAAMCRISCLYINMSCKGQVVYAKSVIQINTNITVSSILWWTYNKCVKTEWFVCVCEREREREKERERAMFINKANNHLTPQFIEHKPVIEISLFWE
jgi:hypothetical protein